MMTIARSKMMHPMVEGTFHCVSRCVRRAFLCGTDAYTGKCYEHRRAWIYDRLVELAGIFWIDVCDYGIMENHLHLILRNRPDLSKKASDHDIALRWWKLFPKRRDVFGWPAEPTEEELAMVLAGEGQVDLLRQRLTSISWLMRCLKEHIAKRANAEDKCTGSFWEGRFKSTALLDQAAVLACSIYVDLNPIRAGLAQTPETSDYTAAQERICARQNQKRKESSGKKMSSTGRYQWLCPLKNRPGRRGYLDMTLDHYLKILDWTGRQIVEGKNGSIPDHLEPILTRLEINHSAWLKGTQSFGTMFYRAAGKVTSLRRTEKAFGGKWLKGKQNSAILFLDVPTQQAPVSPT